MGKFIRVIQILNKKYNKSITVLVLHTRSSHITHFVENTKTSILTSRMTSRTLPNIDLNDHEVYLAYNGLLLPYFYK